jgi:hypothetical protein
MASSVTPTGMKRMGSSGSEEAVRCQQIEEAALSTTLLGE